VSDYLERLVARSFDPRDAIRPRPLGLFEAVPPGGAPTEPVPGQEAPVETTRPPAAVRPPRTEATSREVAVIEVPVPATPVASSVTPSRVAAVNETAAVQPVPATVAPPEPPRYRSQDEARAQPRMTSPPERDRSKPAPPQPLFQRTIVQPLQREVIVERPAAAERRTVQPRRERQPPPVVAAKPSARRSEVSHVPPPPQLPRSRPIRPQVTAPQPDLRSRRDSQSAAEPAAAPTIHVTIGRVEVRAVVQPAAAARRRPAAASPAVMSLDEYLKQRAGGDRS
jgi:hypothetical protein